MHAASHLTISLSPTAHQWAHQFAVEQADPQAGKRVYLNTLAVWAVHRYLAWLQIPSDLEQSGSWSPALRALFDTADLVLPNLGRLECRPIIPTDSEILLPFAATPDRTKRDRIGYVAVQISDRLDEVQLIGFAPATTVSDEQETLPISALQPLDVLLDRLTDLETQAARSTPATHSTPTLTLSHLTRWLQQHVETGWQAVEDLFGPQPPALAFRRAPMRRAKLINLPNQLPIALIVTLTPETPEQLCIHLQVCRVGELAELPPHLQLRVLTGTGDIFREVMAEASDTFIQYEFTGCVGEQFSVEIRLGDAQARENFVI